MCVSPAREDMENLRAFTLHGCCAETSLKDNPVCHKITDAEARM